MSVRMASTMDIVFQPPKIMSALLMKELGDIERSKVVDRLNHCSKQLSVILELYLDVGEADNE